MSSRAREYMKAPRLGPSEEADLLERWHLGCDTAARDRLVAANMRHVVAIANRFVRYPVPYEDLVAEGGLGLVIAIDKFDPGKHVRLVTYASYWIRALMFQAVIREWKRGKTGLGMTRSKTFFRIRRVRALHLARYGADCTREGSMARDLEVSVESLREMLDHIDTWDVSLDGDWTDDVDKRPGMHDRLPDGLPGPDGWTGQRQAQQAMRDVVERALSSLDTRERLVATARLMEDEPRTLAELGRRLGVSRERARQIEVRARMKLGRALRREGLNKTSVTAFLP